MHNPLIERLRHFGPTIFSEMSQLAVRHDAINLGQGFPDTDGPVETREAARHAMFTGHNQYAPGHGIPELRRAVAHHQQLFYGIELDPTSEVMISAGATEAMSACILAMCDSGDEVIALEPTYDCYGGAVAMAGGKLVQVRLHEPAYTLDLDELRRAVTPRTKILIVNSPHNPTGHVLTHEELEAIAQVACEHDLLVFTDEVYEHLVFDGRKHTPIATLPGMAERTITISSAGKTFSTTGWKIGWLTGPNRLLEAAHVAKQNMTYTNGTPFQFGVAAGLMLPPERFDEIRQTYQTARDHLVPGLENAGFTVHPSEGTYYVVADISGLTNEGGMEFCRNLPGRIGVAAIPNQVFYGDPESARNLIRFTFSKRLQVLDEAVERLATLGR